MYKDFYLDIPSGKLTDKIVLSSEDTGLDYTLQRAIILVMFSQYDDLKVSGIPVIELMNKTTVSGVTNLLPSLIAVGDAVKKYLNEDEYVASDVTFSLDTSDDKFSLIINVTLNNEETVSTVIYNG